MSRKVDIINAAYEEMRISGLTVSPDASDLQVALERLEDMMAEFFGETNLNIGYNFEVTPQLNSYTNVPRTYRNMMITNLAMRLLSAFGKQIPETLSAQASQSLSGAIGSVAAMNMREVAPSRRMPVGNGKTFRNVFFNRFQVPSTLPPNEPPTNKIFQGEIFTYREDFSAWLGGNTISSFTIVSDPLLTVTTSANASPLIAYTVSAPANQTSEGPWQQVKITVTDSAGRVDIRIVNFEVLTPPDVG